MAPARFCRGTREKGGGTGRPAAAAAQPESRLRHGARRHLDPGVHVQAPQAGAGNLGIAFRHRPEDFLLRRLVADAIVADDLGQCGPPQFGQLGRSEASGLASVLEVEAVAVLESPELDAQDASEGGADHAAR